MFKGTLFAVAACFLWGLIFVVPQFMTGFSPIEIAMGRYLFYGGISSCILLKSKVQFNVSYPLKIWMKALYFSLFCTIVYYTALVLALRDSGPAIAALVIGISPITIAFYGNWKQKECSYKKLILPSAFIAIGLLIINLPPLLANDFSSKYLFGLFCCAISLFSWTWYVVANADFLKNNKNITPNEWSTLMGVATLFWVIVCGVVLVIGFSDQLDLAKYSSMDETMVNFLMGCTILGFLCAWVGAYLWNRASLYLPVSLAGQLTIFETIFGLLFVYVAAQEIPPLFECVGIMVLLSAVMYGIKQSSDIAPQHATN